jgi:hypothetical protein
MKNVPFSGRSRRGMAILKLTKTGKAIKIYEKSIIKSM